MPCSSPAISDTIGNHIIGPLYHQDDVVTPPLDLADATARLMEAPGLGVDLGPEKLEQYRVG